MPTSTCSQESLSCIRLGIGVRKESSRAAPLHAHPASTASVPLSPEPRSRYTSGPAEGTLATGAPYGGAVGLRVTGQPVGRLYNTWWLDTPPPVPWSYAVAPGAVQSCPNDECGSPDGESRQGRSEEH